jgi:hypothetical protein
LESAELGGRTTMYEFSRFLFPSLSTASTPPPAMLGPGPYAWPEERRAELTRARYAELFRQLSERP